MSGRPAGPNIVLIVADDMGYGDIGAFGNPHVQTPYLDALAAASVRLTQHYAASPVCAPSRAGLLTGRYPHRTGVVDTLEAFGLDRLALTEVTLADRLAEAGYRTGLVGKWHLGALDGNHHPERRGFHEFIGFRGGWIDYWDYRLDVDRSVRRSSGRYVTDVFTDEAVAFIERHKRESFFLHVAYNAPHFPLQAPERDVAPFAELARLTQAVSVLYGMNRRMDAGVGRILDALDRNGLTSSTIVLFTSDNGPDRGGPGKASTVRFNGHFSGAKAMVFEGGIRVPAMIRWPAGLPAGTEVRELVHFVDWTPTLLEMAGVPTEHPLAPRLDGRSVADVLHGDTRNVETQRFWQWSRYAPVPECNAAARDGRWKLVFPRIEEAFVVAEEHLRIDRSLKTETPLTDRVIQLDVRRDLPPPHPPLLYDIEADPYERHDLAATHPHQVDRLRDRLASWFAEVVAERGRRCR